MVNDVVMFDTQRYAGPAAALGKLQALQHSSPVVLLLVHPLLTTCTPGSVCIHNCSSYSLTVWLHSSAACSPSGSNLCAHRVQLNSQPCVTVLLPAHSCSTERLVPRSGSVIPPGRAYHSMSILGDRLYVFGEALVCRSQGWVGLSYHWRLKQF
jgi:hypothetical protein